MTAQLPQLKSFSWVSANGSLILTRDAGLEIVIDEPPSILDEMLGLLDGTRTIASISVLLSSRGAGTITSEGVRSVVEQLDSVGALEDAAASTELSTQEQERYESNLNFFSSFATLSHSRYDYQQAMCKARVLLLGAGGIGSTVLSNLAGLGVGFVRLVDNDIVELKNLSRQFLYTEGDIGEKKVHQAARRAKELNSQVIIEPIHTRIASSEDLASMTDDVDIVISTIDEPEQSGVWVNQAIVQAQLPLVIGGVWARRAQYMAVSPGNSGCLECLTITQASEIGTVRRNGERVNRGIGPVTGVVAGLMTAEALRFVTGFSEPVAAGRMWIIDVFDGRVEVAGEWSRSPSCRVCGTSPARAPRESVVGHHPRELS